MESSACRRRSSDAEQPAQSQSMIVKCEPVELTVESEWRECGVSEAAAAEGLYAGHKVKDELVFGPDVVLQQDIAVSMQNAQNRMEEDPCKPKVEGGADAASESPGDDPHCSRSTEQHELRNYFVRLEQLPVGDIRSCNALNEPSFFCKRESFIEKVRLYPCLWDMNHESFRDIARKDLAWEHIATEYGMANDALSSAEQVACKLEPADETAAESTRTQSTATTCKHMHTGQKPHSCDTCREQLTQRGHLTTHTQTNTVEIPYTYVTYNKRFVYKTKLTVGEKPYSCDICNKRFTKHSYLAKHIRTHKVEEPYTCKTCGKRFKRRANLTRHTRIHTGEKPYSCDICNKLFAHKYNLSKHTLIHTYQKPYGCDICNKRFSLQDELTMHIRIHKEDKPYSCVICNKRFTQRCNLTRHTRTHAVKKSYVCDICKKLFTEKSNLALHIQLHTDEK